MKPKTAAAFVLGLSFGAVCLAAGLWASGAIVAAPPPWKKAAIAQQRPASLPALPQTSMGDVMADLGHVPPPTSPSPDPFDFPAATAPMGPTSRPDFVGPIAPAATAPLTVAKPDFGVPVSPVSPQLPAVDPNFVGPVAPRNTPPQMSAVKPGSAGPMAPSVGPLPDSPAREMMPLAKGTLPKGATGQGEADRVAPELKLPHLAFPLAGIDPKKVSDTFHDSRGSHTHEALDIMSPRGTPVMAVAEGNVAKLFTSKDGGLTVYQFDNSRTLCFYYAHLDRYAPGIQDGTLLRKGQVLGYVGSTGNASPNAPHLHFSLFKLGPEKKWWQGTAIDPLPLFQ